MTSFLQAFFPNYTVITHFTFKKQHVETASDTALSRERGGRRRGNAALWNCIFMISIFTGLTSLPATVAEDLQNIMELQVILKETKKIIEKSDAPVYAPVFDNIPENCSDVALKCYLLELEVILQEEEMLCVTCHQSHNIRSFIEDCSSLSNLPSENCLPCESEIVNTTIFIKRLDELLKAMMSKG
uniref:Interleukin n=1 Tax=Plecoglossus altivelis TaxID=61084 RepID=A0A856EBW2_PLEAT|nr:interleukin 15 [Plecoglossus altivelis]